jgi:DMSO/TMAO reductase YedYZ molybdopterin-dependent catalytic subunit
MKRSTWCLSILIAALALVGGCAQPAPTAEQPPQLSDDPLLSLTGEVENQLSLSMADLHGMDVVERTIAHPKDGNQTYTGVTLITLLERAQPADSATLTFTAADAYSVEVPVGDARACADCLVAFDGDALRLVMPGFGSSYWVKDVVSVEAR